MKFQDKEATEEYIDARRGIANGIKRLSDPKFNGSRIYSYEMLADSSQQLQQAADELSTTVLGMIHRKRYTKDKRDALFVRLAAMVRFDREERKISS